MKTLFFTLLSAGLLSAAEPQQLYFELENEHESHRIALTINDSQVTGTEEWLPKEKDGSHGTIDGIITGGGIIQVLHSFTIEGSEQSEEQVLKLAGDKLLIGEGELVDAGNARMNLKEPNKVHFKTELKKITVTEPKAGSPERKAIMDAMRAPVAKIAGVAVKFTGTVKTYKGWATFSGNADAVDGAKAKEGTLELDFFALLQQDAKGAWQVKSHGFSGDISAREEARENHPKAPWVLFH